MKRWVAPAHCMVALRLATGLVRGMARGAVTHPGNGGWEGLPWADAAQGRPILHG